MIKPVSNAGRRTVSMSRTDPAPPAHRQALAACRTRTTGVGVLLIAVLAVTAAGCGGHGVHAQTGPVPVSSTSTAVSPTPSAANKPTSRQRAATDATVQVHRYERLIDDLAIHPHLSLDRLYSVSTEPDVTDEIGYLNHFREAHDRQGGHVRVMSTAAGAVELVNRPHADPRRRPTIEITACIDVASVQAFGKSGHSIVPKTRKPYYLTRLDLTNVNYPDPRSWLVTKVSARELSSCSA
jgi:hypothetical protein